jgi:hypothetical protein
MKATPYTTKSGIQIGCMYEPPRKWEESVDMENLQSALINPSYRPSLENIRETALWVFNAILLVLLVLGVHYVG